MSQNSLVVANGTGAAVRAALNNGLNTLVTNNSGTAEPSTRYPYMLWADTTNNLLKIRNAANSAWITIGKLSLTNLGLSPIPSGHLWGMTLSNNGSDATNDIDITIGNCASDDTVDANRVLLNPGAMTKQLDAVWAAGSAAGGRISSEALANGTWHVYAFRRSGGTDDYCFSQSLTPTLPDGGTNKRRIGSILRESAAIAAFYQNGDVFLRSVVVSDLNVNTTGTAAVARTLSVPTGLAVEAIVAFSVHANAYGTINHHFITSLAQADIAPSSTVFDIRMGADGAAQHSNTINKRVMTNASAQVRTRADQSSASLTQSIATHGWVDNRGRVN